MVEPITNIEQFALFNETYSESITNLNRTFEELITERGDLSFHFSNQNAATIIRGHRSTEIRPTRRFQKFWG